MNVWRKDEDGKYRREKAYSDNPMSPRHHWLLEQALRIIGTDYEAKDQDIVEELIFELIVRNPKKGKER